jgi:AcrR family transcriptional regulator
MAKKLIIQGIQVKEKILDTAEDLFVRQGINGSSMKAIARAAGFSTGTLSYYFESKSSLIFDVTDRHFDRLTTDLLQWVKSTHGQKDFAEVLGVVFQTIINDRFRGRLHHYLFQEAVGESSSIRQRYIQKYAEWLGMIETGIEDFIPDEKDRKSVAQIILAELDGLILQSILWNRDIEVGGIADRLAKMANPITGGEGG